MPFVLGVIPARGGSKGILKKNLHPLLGIPLIKYTFDAARMSTKLSDFIVTTDCPEILKFSERNKVSTPFIRPTELASDTALAVPTIQHAVASYEKIKGVKVDIVVMLQPTAPLRSSQDIDRGIDNLINNDVDSVMSVVDVGNTHPYKMKIIRNDFLQDYAETGLENPPRQSLPPIYIVNGALYITKRDVLMNRNSFKGETCLPYIMPSDRSVNIDTVVDFVVAEYYLNHTL